MFAERPWDKIALLRLLSGILICIGCSALISLLLSSVVGSSLVTPQQIQDPATLAQKLSNPAPPTDVVGTLLRSSLTPEELIVLRTNGVKTKAEAPAEVTRLLTNVLNRTLSHAQWRDTNILARLSNSPNSRELLAPAKTELEQLRVRRLLLEEGLPGTLAPIHHRVELRSADLFFIQFLVANVAFELGLFWVIARFLRDQGLRWMDFLRGSNPRPIAALPFAIFLGCVSTVMMLAISLVTSEVLTWLNKTPKLQQPLVVLQQAESGAEKVVFALIALVAAPFFEETLFRGILYPTLKQFGFRTLAGPVSAILFGMIHLDLEKFIPLTLFGLVLVFIYEKTQTLLAPMLTHATFNAINFTLFLFHDRLL